jgi:hypothetical protein
MKWYGIDGKLQETAVLRMMQMSMEVVFQEETCAAAIA